MPLHHQFSYNSDSSLRPNEDNLLLILKLVYQNENLENHDITCSRSAFHQRGKHGHNRYSITTKGTK